MSEAQRQTHSPDWSRNLWSASQAPSAHMQPGRSDRKVEPQGQIGPSRPDQLQPLVSESEVQQAAALPHAAPAHGSCASQIHASPLPDRRGAPRLAMRRPTQHAARPRCPAHTRVACRSDPTDATHTGRQGTQEHMYMYTGPPKWGPWQHRGCPAEPAVPPRWLGSVCTDRAWMALLEKGVAAGGIDDAPHAAHSPDEGDDHACAAGPPVRQGVLLVRACVRAERAVWCMHGTCGIAFERTL